jgi:hypothetical protein
MTRKHLKTLPYYRIFVLAQTLAAVLILELITIACQDVI